MTEQVPPADELHAVRAHIKELEQREAELRTLMFRDPSARTGNHFVAEIKQVEQTRTDIKELRKGYPDIAEQFTFTTAVAQVVLKAINEDGEIVSIRRKKEQAP